MHTTIITLDLGYMHLINTKYYAAVYLHLSCIDFVFEVQLQHQNH